MNFGLVCSDSIRPIMLELLSSRRIAVDDNADIFIVESGFDSMDSKLVIVFTMANLNYLIKLLDGLSKPAEEPSDTIIGKSAEDRYEIVQYDKICYFEARGNNVFCITSGGEYRVKEKLYELEGKLPQNRFVKVSKSFIVNISSVKEIIPWFGRRLVLKFINSKKEVEVSKNYVKSFKEYLGM